ncbi:MAG: Calx-beta domain-containing protein, partial [Chthoniobacterales bacterium]
MRFPSVLILPLLGILSAAPCYAAPEVSINDVSVAESAGTAVFTLTLSAASATPVTVDWNTEDGTAIAPGDFTSSSGVATFPANTLTRTVSVPIINDTDGELAETFNVVLSNPSANASISDATGVATIQESDITTLSWDPGTAHLGTLVQTGTSSPVGRRYFKINAQAAVAGGWRTALRVTAGEANLYASRNTLPLPESAERSSAQTGSDGWVLQPDEFTEGDTWYFLVDITATATWRFYTGDVFIQNMGTLQYTDTNANGAYNIGEPVLPSGSGAVDIGPEGMRFFTGQAPNGTPAWSLWLNGDTRPLAVKQGGVPFSSAGTFDHQQNGAMLLVPSYLVSNSAFFFSVSGTPGTTVNLDSRIQTVTDVAFNSTQTNVSVTDAPFRVYRVTVPIDQIAWDISTTAGAGNPNVAVRRDDVPSQWFNDAFSEVSGLATDSVTLVPQFLTNGTWFITVYGSGSYTFTLRNGPPTITPITYADTKINDQPTRAGWRYYSVSNIASQVGSLGWQLALAGQVPGTEIAIRRNAVPGRWNYRNAFDGTPSGNPGYVDAASTSGLLQRPGQQADIWYVGVYSPANPLGTFTLTTTAIAPTTVTFNGGTSAVSGQQVQSWKFFRVDVPAGVLGWDVRVRSVTGGDPEMVIRRDVLPDSLSTGGTWWWGNPPSQNASWASGNSWIQSLDWTQRYYNADGTEMTSRRFVAGMGRPLEPGTYYVGVYNADSANPAGYTLESRG